MKLHISDPKRIVNAQCKRWLIRQLRDELIAAIDVNKIKLWDKFFNDQAVFKSLYKKHHLTSDIIVAGAQNLRSVDIRDGFIIEINPSVYTPGLDRQKLAAMCRLINFGNQEIKGYPIFTNTFTEFAENINSYLQLYLFSHN